MKIKRQSEILSNMIDYTSSITTDVTDFTVGSAVRSMYDAFSIEEELFYMLTMENINEGIEKGLMASFGFEAKAPTAAYGNVTIEFYTAPEQDFLVSKGTRFMTASQDQSLYFQTTKAYTIPGGSTSFTLAVEANQTGSVGNVRAREISRSEANLYNVSSVYNTEDFLTGSDGETYPEALKRFAMYIESIGRATKNAIKYGALTVPYIDTAYVHERIGRVDVYVADKNGNLTASQQSAVQNFLEDYRPAGIELYVWPMIRRDIDVIATVQVTSLDEATVDLQNDMVQQVRNYLNSFTADQDFVLHDLERLILNYDTDLIYDVDITNLTGNYKVAEDEIIRSGQVSLTFKEAGDGSARV